MTNLMQAIVTIRHHIYSGNIRIALGERLSQGATNEIIASLLLVLNAAQKEASRDE